MNSSEEQFRRLKEFAIICFGGIPQLAAAMKKNKSVLYSYPKKNSKPGNKLRAQLEEIGCNPDWISMGSGSMFAPNDAGRVLKEQFGHKVKDPLPEYRSKLDTRTIGRSIELMGLSIQEHAMTLDDHEVRIVRLEKRTGIDTKPEH